MTYHTQNARLMRRLGFVADPKTKPQIIPHNEATYWRHQPSGVCVVTLHGSHYTEAEIVRTAISAATHTILKDVDTKVAHVFGEARRNHENAMANWQAKR